MSNYKALILAGGFGTRLQEVVKNVPKPMASIAGKPFLEHQIRFLKKHGIEDIILGVHYKSGIIKSYFGNGMRQDVKLTYSEEETPLDTGGAVKLAQKYIDGPFLVLNGDSYSDVNLNEFIKFHEIQKTPGSMVLQSLDSIEHYGNVELQGNLVTEFKEKASQGKGLINAGIYLFKPEILDQIPESTKISLEKSVFPNLVKDKKISGFVHDGYFMDIGRPETYFQFKKDFLERLQSSTDLELREALRRMYDQGSDILFMVDSDKKFLGLLTDGVIKRYLINGGDFNVKVTDAMIKEPDNLAIITDSEEKIKKHLQEGVKQLPVLDENGRIHDIRFRTEELKEEEYPTIRGKTPLRISFAGGGTDMPYFFEEYGGAVISTTIDKYCRITAKKRGDSKLVIDSDMVDKEAVFDTEKLIYDGGTFDLVKSVYNLVNPGCGIDLFLNNDIPPGRGLGSSATFAVLLTKILGKLKGTEFGDEDLAEIAYKAETQELAIKGGKQDQYAAIFGGFKWIEFGNGDKKIMHPLRIKEDTLNELHNHLTLCYTGKGHQSTHQQKSLAKSYNEDRSKTIERLKRIKEGAILTRDYLLSPTPNFKGIGEILHQSWLAKKEVSSAVTNERIDSLYQIGRDNGCYGGKLLGSGGGGYILFFHSPEKRNKLEKSLINEGGEILDFNFANDCATIWNGK
ncbi:MAG TPA: NTP transferase domain-containing protein [Nanoarchaeota archaeon]|nr:NTP transferase domain-containing protein [Nanoarchaeota archaeon]HIH63876.1 NTP transferase domain-containing protein [Nanoarchaeota archaeon]HIJ09775.1 NTP transferase domain-containing protein [Nanoarchaeota archaeon]